MDDKTVKKFKNLTRRSSIYMIFDGPAIHNQQLKSKNEKKNTFHSDNNESSSSSNYKTVQGNKTSKKFLPEIEKNMIDNNFSISKKRYSQKVFNRYKENRLPVLTNSEELMKEMKNMSIKDNYYKKFVSETNFGEKYCKINPAYEDFSKINKEENLIKMGLNNEEKNPLQLIDKKVKNNYSNKNLNNNINKYDNYHFLLLRNKKLKNNTIFQKTNNFSKLTKKNNNIKLSSYKAFKTSFIKKKEFSNFLIMEYIKKNFPSMIEKKDINIDKASNSVNNEDIKEKKLLLKYLGKGIEARRIYVIKDSTVISNPRLIPGFLVEIPTIKGMKLLKKNQKFNLMKDFLEFITIKFRTQLFFNYIFDKNGNLVYNFEKLPEKEKYIFVSPINIFQGFTFSMHKGIIELYLKHFGKNNKEEYFFNESSIDESYNYIHVQNDKNNHFNNFEENDDVYDLFFSDTKNKNKLKYFKKIKFQKRIKHSFTFGIDDNNENDYKYIYYSDNEQKRDKIYNKISKNRVDFYLEIKNSIYDKKLKELRMKLSENKGKNNLRNKSSTKLKKEKKILLTDEEQLRKEYLSEKKIKIKNLNMLDEEENRPLKCQDLVDTFNLLKSYEPSLETKKFYIPRKPSKNKYFPYIAKNKIANIDKYYYNRKKTNLEYPSLLNFNIPKILKEHPKYSLKDLIRYYTKFKSLINLWFNLHTNVNNSQFGIDFETFYNCTEELSKEEKELALRIYEKINNSPNGFLSLEDFIDALNCINQNDISNQFYFFLKIFGSSGKKFLSYEEVLKISLISIKRLVKNKKTKEDGKIIRDLGNFFANYLFKICEAKLDDGIEIDKLKKMLNSQGEKLEYLKLFFLIDDDRHKGEIIKVLKEFKKKNKIK